jgi:hypothetical protein
MSARAPAGGAPISDLSFVVDLGGKRELNDDAFGMPDPLAILLKTRDQAAALPLNILLWKRPVPGPLGICR